MVIGQWRTRAAAIGLGIAAAAGVAAWVFMHNAQQEPGARGPEEAPEKEAPENRNAEPQKRVHLPTPVASEVEAQGDSVCVTIDQNVDTMENSVFNAEGQLEQQNSVFESLPEGGVLEAEEDELLSKGAGPMGNAALAQSLDRIVNAMHEHAECNPAVVHLACVGFDYLGPQEDGDFNPAVCSPVMLGYWHGKNDSEPAAHPSAHYKRKLASPGQDAKRERKDVEPAAATPAPAAAAASPASSSAVESDKKKKEAGKKGEASSPAAHPTFAQIAASPPADHVTFEPAAPATTAASHAAHVAPHAAPAASAPVPNGAAHAAPTAVTEAVDGHEGADGDAEGAEEDASAEKAAAASKAHTTSSKKKKHHKKKK